MCLQNFIKRNEDKPDVAKVYCLPGYVDSEDIKYRIWRQVTTFLPSVGRLSANNSARDLHALRDKLSSYFVSPLGKLPLQNNIIQHLKIYSI